MLKVRTAVANGTLAADHAAAEGWARRPFRLTAQAPRFWTVSVEEVERWRPVIHAVGAYAD